MRSGPSPWAGLLRRKATLELTTLWACLVMHGVSLAQGNKGNKVQASPTRYAVQVRLDQRFGSLLAGAQVHVGDQPPQPTDETGRVELNWPSSWPTRLTVAHQGATFAVINDVVLGGEPPSKSTGPALLVSSPKTVQAWRQHHLAGLAISTQRQQASMAGGVDRTASEFMGPPIPFPSGVFVGGESRLMMVGRSGLAPSHPDTFDQVALTWAALADKRAAHELPHRFRLGLQAWWRGQADQALQAMSLQRLRAASVPAESPAEAAQAWMLRAILQLATGDQQGAIETGWLATSALPEQPQIWHLLGQLLMHVRGADDELLIHTALQNARRLHGTVPPAPQATAQVDALDELQGRLLEKLGRLPQAEQHWATVKARHAAAMADADLHPIDLASKAAMKQALVQMKLKRHEAALDNLNGLLTWRRELARRDPTLQRQYDIATALLNQVTVKQSLKRGCEAEAPMNEAWGIMSEIAELDPARFLARKREMPYPLSCVFDGKVHLHLGEVAEPPRALSARDIQNLPSDQWDAMSSQWKSASRMHEHRSPGEAAQWSLRVLALQLRQAETSGTEHDEAIARTLTRVGSLHQMAGNKVMARRAYQQALERWARLKGHPGSPPWTEDISNTLYQRIAELPPELKEP
jgi:tetratricopeptide (TPR) repeat protein